MTVQLAGVAPFARGGNRLCFVHPAHPDRCIKVRRPEFTLEDLRRSKGFPKNLRPLSWFDDNLEEFGVMQDIDRQTGEVAYELVSRCHGFEDTDMGRGLASELIRDGKGTISNTLKQYLWDHGYTPALQDMVSRFAARWITLALPSRDLLLHNILVQCGKDDSEIRRLVVIDGLGSAGIIPYAWLPMFLRRYMAQRKIAKLGEKIRELLAARETGTFPGRMGKLFHHGQPEREKSE